MAEDLVAILAYKSVIDARLVGYLTQKKDDLSPINTWAADLIDRLIPFTTGGKTIRGSLVIYTYRLFASATPKEVLDVAVALELFQSGLLIHDDIMDRDTLRRGSPTISAQYEAILTHKNLSDATHFGVSQAINAADLCYFLGYELLAPSSKNPSLLSTISHELSSVVIAQMQDVYGGTGVKAFTAEEILSLYTYKTARYSFSLPFVMGALLAKQKESVIQQLRDLGEQLGLLYQLRDDTLGVTGEPTLTGKPVGTDAKEHKQTYLAWLKAHQPKNAASIFQHKLDDLLERSETIINALPITSQQKNTLYELAIFTMRREK